MCDAQDNRFAPDVTSCAYLCVYSAQCSCSSFNYKEGSDDVTNETNCEIIPQDHGVCQTENNSEWEWLIVK